MKHTLLLLLSLAFSCVGNATIFFLDAQNDTLSRVDLNGGNRVDLVNLGLGVPYGLAVDEGASKLYWTLQTSGADLIQRANLDGSNLETLYTFSGGGEFGAIQPTAILLDTKGSRMYFTDIANDKLWAGSMDGGGQLSLSEQVNFRNAGGAFTSNEVYGLAAPNTTSLTYTMSFSSRDGIYNTTDGTVLSSDDPGAIVADMANNRYIYSTFGASNEIRAVDFDGGNDRLLIAGRKFVQGGGGISVLNGKLYWTEQGGAGENAIWTADLDGSNPQQIYTNTGYLYGIAAIPEPALSGLICGLCLGAWMLVSRRRQRS